MRIEEAKTRMWEVYRKIIPFLYRFMVWKEKKGNDDGLKDTNRTITNCNVQTQYESRCE